MCDQVLPPPDKFFGRSKGHSIECRLNPSDVLKCYLPKYTDRKLYLIMLPVMIFPMVKPSTSLWTFEVFTWLGWKLKHDSCLPRLIQLPFCVFSLGNVQYFFVYGVALGLQHYF